MVEELLLGDIPHKLDQNFWKNREQLEEMIFLCTEENWPSTVSTVASCVSHVAFRNYRLPQTAREQFALLADPDRCQLRQAPSSPRVPLAALVTGCSSRLPRGFLPDPSTREQPWRPSRSGGRVSASPGLHQWVPEGHERGSPAWVSMPSLCSPSSGGPSQGRMPIHALTLPVKPVCCSPI